MEDQHKPTQKTEKVFSFLSKDEVEKLKQEEERKIATLCRDKKKSRLFDDGNRKIDSRDDDDDNDNHDDNDNEDGNDYSEDDDDEDTDDDREDAVDMHHQQHIRARNANDNIDVLREALSDDDAEYISSKTINQTKNLKPTTKTKTTNKISKLKAPTQNIKETKVKDECKENIKKGSIANKKAPKVMLKPKIAPAVITRDQKVSTMPETIEKSTASTQELIQKPSLLPKPKVKVVIPPALLQKQQQKTLQHPHQQEQQHEVAEEVPADVAEAPESEVALTASSRIPVRTANAEKRALMAGITTHSSSSEENSPSSSSELKKSKTLINAEKRASWRAARLRSLEKGAVEAQSVIQNMTKIADDLLTDTFPTAAKKIVFPKIAIKSSDGAVIIREREKILDEKIVRRTEEVACPITGRPQLRTVEYIEKIIETEVETSREKIISLELQDPEKSDTPHASLDLMTPQQERIEKKKCETRHDDNQEQVMLQKTRVSEDKKHEKGEESVHLPGAMSRTLVEKVEKLHIQQKYEDSSDSFDKEMQKKIELQDFLNISADRELVMEEEEEDNGVEMVEDEEECEEETDSASIVTVQQNIEKLFLRNDDDEFPSIELDSLGSGSIFGPSSLESVGSSTKVSIKPSTMTMHQSLAKEIVLPPITNTSTTLTTTHTKSLQKMDDNEFHKDDDDEDCEDSVSTTNKTTLSSGNKKAVTTRSKNIVEVVNPLIAGDGQVQRIAFSRSHRSDYPSFDKDDETPDALKYTEHEVENFPSTQQVVRSDTFVLPAGKACEELSLNAKMKNVLEELLENERVKYNLQKSLEEQVNKAAFGDTDDDDDDDDDEDENSQTRDVIDFAEISEDDNGNRHVLNALIRDSNKNPLQKLKSQLRDNETEKVNENIDDEEEEDEVEYEPADEEEEESDDTEESESSDSDDDEDDDDDDETIHITFVDGAKVIENFNTNTPMKLQKSQTYNTMEEAAEALTEKPEVSRQAAVVEQQQEYYSPPEDDTQVTLEKLLAEQQKYAEISKQLRKSVENLLVDDDEINDPSSSASRTTITDPQQKEKLKNVLESKKKSKPMKTRPDSAVSETGEEIFNRLLDAGGSRRQIFDQETDEILTTSTTTCTEDNGTIITTTTTTISNITTSGIPRNKKHIKKATNKNNGNNNDRDEDHRDRDSGEES